MKNVGMRQLLQKIYDGYGFSDAAGIAYFEGYATELSSFDFESIICYQVDIFPSRYVLDFLLATPFLWRPLPSEVWVRILTRGRQLDGRKEVRDQTAVFADIVFLSRYVGLDVMGFLMSSATAIDDKTGALSYFKRFPFELASSDLDNEDLDGVYFVEKKWLDKLCDSLCSSHGFARAQYAENNVGSYVFGLTAQ